MWVKICGNTNLEDAQLAGELGASAVGFVFAPSIRMVTPAQVARITPHLPETLDRVGVFPAWSADEIAGAALEAGLTTVQLHGAFSLRLLHTLSDRLGDQVRIIQVLHWAADPHTSSEAEVAEQLRQVRSSSRVDRILVDSKVGTANGGTGIAFDWTAALGVFAGQHDGIRLILAGGLRADNVAQAIERLQPWGVDVASGVEAVPRHKDPEQMTRFIEAARRVRVSPPTLGPDAKSFA